MDTQTADGRDGSTGIVVTQELATLIERASRSFEADPNSARDCLSRASALLRAERVMRRMSAQITSEVCQRGGLAPWQLKRVMAYIDEHCGSHIRAADLASLVRLSTSHFNRSFKISVGVPPFSYITSKRIEVACELMANTEDELCDIAIACGMADQSHFCRVFRRFVGVSPGVWRRSHFDGARRQVVGSGAERWARRNRVSQFSTAIAERHASR